MRTRDTDTWEYRVTWISPSQGPHAERCPAEWYVRERARQLTDGGMVNVRMERRPVSEWQTLLPVKPGEGGDQSLGGVAG